MQSRSESCRGGWRRVGGRGRRAGAGVWALALLLWGGGSVADPAPGAPGGEAGAARPSGTPSARIGLTEKAGVTIALLDIEVTDRDGRPLRGLAKEDFKLRLDGQTWPIYSLDDLCAAPAAGGGDVDSLALPSQHVRSPAAGASPGEMQTAGAPPAAARIAGASAEMAVPPEGPGRTVLYLDFSRLREGGRSRSLEEARRWIRIVRREEDEVMIAAYAPAAGLVVLAPFTRQASVLEEAIARAETDPSLLDSYPNRVHFRVTECNLSIQRCQSLCRQRGNCDHCIPTPDCDVLAREEYGHGREGLNALRELIARMELLPGRKDLLFFLESGTVHPARLYATTDLRAGDHEHLVAEIGAEANLARTRIHGAFLGDSLTADLPVAASGGVNLGASLADATGGSYSRDLVGLGPVTTAVRDGGRCLYRIGIEAPDPAGRGPHMVKIKVRGRTIPHRYRVAFLSEVDRRWRRVASVLRDPGAARSIGLSAALVPLRMREGTWDAAVVLSFDLDEVALVPERDGDRGDWEAGAIVTVEGADEDWEMLGVSSVHRAASASRASGGARVLHAGELEELAPGQYRLRGFVRDSTADLLGGAEAAIRLPSERSGGLTGPLLFLSGEPQVRAPLPRLGGRAVPETKAAGVLMGAVPLPAGSARSGDTIEALSWVCPVGDAVDTSRLIRYIAQGGIPRFKLPPPRITPAGTCHRVRDSLATGALEPGAYTYVIRWRPAHGAAPIELEAAFRVDPGPSMPAERPSGALVGRNGSHGE